MAAAMAKAPLPPGGKSAPALTKPASRRGGEARRLSDLLPTVGEASFRKFGFIQSAVVTRWPEIAGARIARMASPQSIAFPRGKKADGVLTIAVTGAHGPVVQMVVPDLIARVNRFFGYAAVARIKLVPATMTATRAATAPLPANDPPPATIAISPQLRAIADPELRSVLEGLAASLATRDALPRIG